MAERATSALARWSAGGSFRAVRWGSRDGPARRPSGWTAQDVPRHRRFVQPGAPVGRVGSDNCGGALRAVQGAIAFDQRQVRRDDQLRLLEKGAGIGSAAASPKSHASTALDSA